MNNPTSETLRSPQGTNVSSPPPPETAQVEWTSAQGSIDRETSQQPQKLSRKLRNPLFFNLVLPLLILAGAGILFVLLGKSEAPQRPADDMSRVGILKRLPTADVTPVHSLEDFGGRLNLTVDGVVVPFREVQLATEVAGRITYKDPVCEAGNFVRKGQLLFRIDPKEYQLDVDRLTQMREQEYQQLGELDQEMSNAQRLLEVAEQDLALRKREVNRLESLPQGFASEGELDQARRAELQALQARVTLQNEIALLEKRRRRLETSERLAATQLELAQLNLDRTEIGAPVSGVIVQEDAELNSFVQRGSPIITIEDTSKAEVAISLRMDQLHWVLDQRTEGASGEAAKDVETLVSANPQSYRLPETEATIEYSIAGRKGDTYRWEGRLLRYDGIGLNPQTRTMPVSVVVDHPRQVSGPQGSAAGRSGPMALVRGMFVQVTLHINPQTKLVVLPAKSLQPGNRVWRFRPDDSVLEVEPVDKATDIAPVSEEEDTQLADSQQSIPDATEDAAAEPKEDEFEPEEWVAGTVRAVEGIRPIESVSPARFEPPAKPNIADPGARVPSDGEEMYWICEVTDLQLQAGDYLVTTPLSSIPTGGEAAVRVPVDRFHPPTRGRPALIEPRSTAAIVRGTEP